MENRTTTTTGYIAELRICATDAQGIIDPRYEYRYESDLTPDEVEALFNAVVWDTADHADTESGNFKRSALNRYAIKHGIGAIKQT